MEDTVLLGHGSGGTMMKRIIDEVFFDAYAGDELLRGDDAAVLMPFALAAGADARAGEAANLGATGTGDILDGSASTNPSSPTDAGAAAADAAGAGAAAADAAGAGTTSRSPSVPSASLHAFPQDASSQDGRIAFSTDSFVVSPHFFPGGDIGRLAVCGTVNDIATSGAIPLYLSCGFILEEGYPIADLKRICASMAKAAREAGVRLVTGDTKVVNRGHGDGVFINTSGIGVVPAGVNLSGAYCQPGDKVLVSGTLGDHGITIMSCRESLSFSADIQSDAAPLNHLIADVLRATGSVATEAPADKTPATGHHAEGLSAPGASGAPGPSHVFTASSVPGPSQVSEVSTSSDKSLEPGRAGVPLCPVRCFRDPTRGGLASTLNELAAQSCVDIQVDEDAIPVKPQVLGACDMLGYDVLQVANEGKMVCVVAPEAADAALAAMRANPYGVDAAIIGEVSAARADRGPKVYVRNAFGGRRILDMLVGEQLPRIC